jgi:hypothetical protein
MSCFEGTVNSDSEQFVEELTLSCGNINFHFSLANRSEGLSLAMNVDLIEAKSLERQKQPKQASDVDFVL